MSDSKMVLVPLAAVEWLQLHKPVLCEKAGLRISAAPAEDVRAVDEPVAWLLDGSVGGSSLEFQMTDLLELQNRHGGVLTPLYRHAQPITQSPLHPPQSTWPTWANWCGLNTDGYWWFYENEPTLMQAGRVASSGRFEMSPNGEPSNAWASMIFQRVNT